MTSSRTREATWRLCSDEGLAPDSTIGGDRAWDRIWDRDETLQRTAARERAHPFADVPPALFDYTTEEAILAKV